MASKVEPYYRSTPELGKGVFIHPDAHVSGCVKMGEDCSVWPNATVRGDVHYITIGDRTNVQDNAVLHVTHAHEGHEGYPLNIGDDVTIAHGVILHGCTIENQVLVGMNAVILDGAHVESGVMVGAGTLVVPNQRLKTGWLYIGQPAVAMRALKPEEIEKIAYNAAHYVTLKSLYMDSAVQT